MTREEVEKYTTNWMKYFIPVFDPEYSSGEMKEAVIRDYDYKYTTLKKFLLEFVKLNFDRVESVFLCQPSSTPLVSLEINFKNDNYLRVDFDCAYGEYKIDYGNIIVIYVHHNNYVLDNERSFSKHTKDIQEAIGYIRDVL